MPENPPQLVGNFDDRDHLHLGTAFRADKRIDLVDLCEKPGPGTFAGVNTELFLFVPQRFIAQASASAGCR